MRLYFISLTLLFVTSVSYSQEIPKLLLNTATHSAKVRGLAFDKNGNQLVSLSEDQSIRWWQMSDGALNKKEVQNRMLTIDPSWKLDGEFICRNFLFKDFAEAFVFLLSK